MSHSAHEESGLPRLERRTVLKWMVAAAGVVSALDEKTFGVPDLPAPGIGTDPDLMNPIVPWPRTLSQPQLRTVAALCNAIIPADERSPAASAVGVHEFIDEWISAPYPQQQEDRRTILEGLVWLDEESRRRFDRDFADLAEDQKAAICDDIHDAANAPPRHHRAAAFFNKMRHLTVGAFYTTPEGMADLGYIGNVPLASFDGPPPQVLRRLGLD